MATTSSQTRFEIYIRQSGRQYMTARQTRRYMKKLKRDLYCKPCFACKRKPMKCECPF
jgi:hypothetical protein